MIKTPVKPSPNSLLGMVTRYFSVTPRQFVFIILGLAALFLLYSKSPLRNIRISICLRRSSSVRPAGEEVSNSVAADSSRSMLDKQTEEMILKGIVPADPRLSLLPVKKVPDTAKFHAGIVLVVEKKADDPNFLKAQWAAYRGIGHQKYPEWTLFFVAVGFTDADKTKTYELLKQYKIDSSRVQWISAASEGVAAGNAGLDAAEAHASVTHVAWCGQYDLWFPDHLGAFAGNYAGMRDCGFMFSQAAATTTFVFPQAAQPPEVRLDNFIPQACMAAPGFGVWNLARINPRLRTVEQQQQSDRMYKTCCSKQCERGTVLPPMDDLIDRVTDLANSDSVHTFLVYVCTGRTYATTLPELEAEAKKSIKA